MVPRIYIFCKWLQVAGTKQINTNMLEGCSGFLWRLINKHQSNSRNACHHRLGPPCRFQFSVIFLHTCLLDQGKNKTLTGFLPFAVALLFLDLQNTTESGAAAETLAEVPEHVLRGLPEEVRLFPSAVDKSRIGEYQGYRRDREGRAGCSQASFGTFKVGSSL